jgi:tight adherence protein B
MECLVDPSRREAGGAMIGVAFLVLLVFALVGQAAWLLTEGLQEQAPNDTPVARRLEDYTRITWESKPVDTSTILRRRRLSRFPRLEGLLKRLDLAEKLSRDLRGAGVQIQAAEFLFVQLVITTLAGFAAFVSLPHVLGGLAPAAGAALLGLAAPVVWLRQMRAKRLKLFEESLPDALDLLAGSLRAGYSTADGLEIVAREGSGPCSEEFAEVVQELNLGADLEAALARMLERVPNEDARLLVAAIAVQRRTGGNLVDVLKQLARTLRERRRLRNDVQVLTTGPRLSGYVAGALPLLMVVGMYFTSRKSFDLLVSEPTGRIVLAGSGVLVLVGLFLNSRIANVDV